MNKLRLLLVLFLGIFLLFGCKTWDEPEFDVKEWERPSKDWAAAPWAIGGRFVLGAHVNGELPDSLVPKLYANTIRYIRAVVVSTDEGGNYYKAMVIQDSTGGVQLQLDMTGLYNMYPVGQKIVLVCNGLEPNCPALMIGDYNSLPQIGWIYNETQVGRISTLFLDKYIIKDGLPNLKNVPKPLTNNAPNVSDRIDFLSHRDINKLVRLENVIFEEAAIGNPLAFNDVSATDWKVTVPLANGKTETVTVRTSNYAKFRNTIIQKKEYNLTGILTIYRSSYQLMIRTKEDIEEASQLLEVVEFDFTNNPLENGWRIQPAQGTTPWIYRESLQAMRHPGNRIAGYNTTMDDWLISPEITFPDWANGYLRFEHQLSVPNKEFGAYKVYYSTSNSSTFDINNWKPLETFNSYPDEYEWSNLIPIKNINANKFRIAFRYHAPNIDVETYEWNIMRVEIRN